LQVALNPNDGNMLSTWDRDLPNLKLENVTFHASSLIDAWKSLSIGYLARSILVTPDRASEVRPFDYQSVTCTAKDIYDALAATYGLGWVHDELTGVAWFHPVELPAERILRTRVETTRDQLGLPMQSAILEPLGESSATSFAVKQWGSLFENTFDYAVDVPANVYTVQDLLNLCCIANPTKTFHVQVGRGGFLVTAVNLVSDVSGPAPLGALHLWDLQVGQARGDGALTGEQLTAALADQQAEVRRAARNYLEATIWAVEVDELVTRSTSTEQALWTCIGITSILARSEEATHRASIETMERLATDEFLAVCEPGLAVMTALELSRLTKDARALGVIEKRDFKATELSSVISDACRVAALSSYVREALQSKSAEDLVEALGPLAATVRLPTAGKLEFKLAS
jgi:hypothetical protein